MADPNINPETGESTATRSSRFSTWGALLIFSTITLGASVEVKNNSESVEASTKWAVGCSVVSLLIAGVVTAMHLHALASSMIVGTKIEGVLAIVLAASWAACVAVVTNASNGLGIENDNTVKNANLYYFSWAGFVASIVLLVSYLREAFGVDVVGNIRERGARLTQWAALLATSLIVMGSSARTFSNQCQPNLSGDDAYCARTKFGIALGVLAVMGSLAIVGMKMLIAAAPLKMELGVSGVLAILNAFGVAYITSAKGPGATIGNLYYSIWLTFLLSAFVAFDCFGSHRTGSGSTTQQNEGSGAGGDIEVENMDDSNI